VSNKEQFSQALIPYLPQDTKAMGFYYRGRVGLFAILKAMGVGTGDEVVIQGFTCVVVPNAIIYLKATPVYVDISPETNNTTLAHIAAAITSKTKVVVIQNTLGLSSEVEEITSFCRSKGIYTIEDCTHGFGGTYNGKPNGAFCDAAFYSTQWNKPFSTGIGGFAIVRNENLVTEFNAATAAFEFPSGKQNAVLRLLLWFRKNIMKGVLYWTLLKFYRFLSKSNLIIGSSSGEEISSIEMPEGYAKLMGSAQFEAGLKALVGFDEVLKTRKKNALHITSWLKTNGFHFVPKHLESNHSFLKYPLFVKNREAFMELAEQNSMPLGDWFVSPIHPVEENLDVWGVELDKLPVAKKLSKHIVNLPTDGTVAIEKLLAFLAENKGHIFEENFTHDLH